MPKRSAASWGGHLCILGEDVHRSTGRKLHQEMPHGVGSGLRKLDHRRSWFRYAQPPGTDIPRQRISATASGPLARLCDTDQPRGGGQFDTHSVAVRPRSGVRTLERSALAATAGAPLIALGIVPSAGVRHVRARLTSRCRPVDRSGCPEWPHGQSARDREHGLRDTRHLSDVLREAVSAGIGRALRTVLCVANSDRRDDNESSWQRVGATPSRRSRAPQVGCGAGVMGRMIGTADAQLHCTNIR